MTNAAANELSAPGGILDAHYVNLAHEIAKNLRPIDQVLTAFKLSAYDFATLCHNPAFNSLLRAATAQWGSADNTDARSRLKALIAIEDLLFDMHQSAKDSSNPLNHRVAAFVALRDHALGKGAETTGGIVGGGSKWSLNIFLSGDKPVTIEGTVEAPRVPAVTVE